MMSSPSKPTEPETILPTKNIEEKVEAPSVKNVTEIVPEKDTIDEGGPTQPLLSTEGKKEEDPPKNANFMPFEDSSDEEKNKNELRKLRKKAVAVVLINKQN